MPTNNDPLDSENWASESSVQSPDAQGAGSGSPPPPDPCDPDSTAPESEYWMEAPTEFGVGPPPNGADGLTRWKGKRPKLNAGPFCDGESGVWVCRVIGVDAQQEIYIKDPAFPLTEDSIVEADCATLKDMWQGMNNAKNNVIFGAKYVPVEIIEAHENVHKDNGSTYGEALFGIYRAAIEAIPQVPCEGNDYDAALKAMAQKMKDAENDFVVSFIAAEDANARHEPPDPFLAAQAPIAKAWMAKIRAVMVTQGCPNIPDPVP